MFFAFLGLLFGVLGAGLLALVWTIGDSADAADSLGLGITGGTFLFMGVIFLLVGLLIRRSHTRAERLRQAGTQGQATITAVDFTSMRVNDRPVVKLKLRLDVPGRPAYDMNHSMVMPWEAMGRTGVGQVVPVRVDPDDPKQVLIEWEAVPPMVTMAQSPNVVAVDDGNGSISFGPAAAPPAAVTAQLSAVTALPTAATALPTAAASPPTAVATSQTTSMSAGPAAGQAGMPGRATIRSSEDLGEASPGKRQVRLGLEVSREGHAPYYVSHMTQVSETTMLRLLAGGSVAVLVDPSDPQGLVIDWDGA